MTAGKNVPKLYTDTYLNTKVMGTNLQSRRNLLHLHTENDAQERMD